MTNINKVGHANLRGEFRAEVTVLTNCIKTLLLAIALAVPAVQPGYARDISSPPGSSHPVPGAFLQGYNTGSATCTFVTTNGHHGFKLQNANHDYDCNNSSCGNSAGIEFLIPNFSRLNSITFSLSNVTNGTVNLYLLTGQTPIPTFSVSFAQLNGASLVVKPSQFSPPIEQGSIGSLFIDANPCQQAIISDIRINTSSGQIIPNPTDSCPPVICQPPN